MATFMMFGNYSAESIADISSKRTHEVSKLIKSHSGEVRGIYALLGGYDLVMIVDLPDVATAMKLSVEFARVTGISFTTHPALDVKEFDELVG